MTHYYYYYYCDYYCDYDDYLLGRATHSHPVEPRGHGRLAVRQGGEQRVEHLVRVRVKRVSSGPFLGSAILASASCGSASLGLERSEHVDDEVARVAHLSKARRDRVSSRLVWGLFGGGSSPAWHT